jgi:Replication-relaxation
LSLTGANLLAAIRDSRGGQAILKPDLYAVTASRDFEDSWFIEVDRGTESLPTLLRKCGQYEEYRRSGVEQRDRQVFPLVLWRRRMSGAGMCSGRRSTRPPGLDRSLFRAATFDELISAVTEAASND